jgi:hypothetical protein
MLQPIGAFRNKNRLVADCRGSQVAGLLIVSTRWNSLLGLNQDTPRPLSRLPLLAPQAGEGGARSRAINAAANRVPS